MAHCLFFPGGSAAQIRVNVLFHVRGKDGHRAGQFFLINLQRDFPEYGKRGQSAGFLRAQRAVVIKTDAALLCCGASAPQQMQDEEH